MKQYLSLTVVAVALMLSSTTLRAHEHHAPHKGTLVEFGEEFAHLELVIDQTTGKVSAYVLDGEAEKAVRVAQEEIEIKVSAGTTAGSGPVVGFTVPLKAQASVLSGEKVGDTSEFAGQNDMLKNLPAFDAIVTKITVKGKTFEAVKFNYPKGNEEEAKK